MGEQGRAIRHRYIGAKPLACVLQDDDNRLDSIAGPVAKAYYTYVRSTTDVQEGYCGYIRRNERATGNITRLLIEADICKESAKAFVCKR